MTTQLEPSIPLLRQRRSLDIFVCTLVISLLLHLAASTVFLLPGGYSVPSGAPLFVDLKSMALPAETPPPPDTTPAEALPPEPEPAAPATPETARLEKSVDSARARAVETPAAVHESGIGLGMMSGHFASFAQGETLKDEIRVYYFELMRRINEVWWTTGATQGSYVAAASVILTISRDGRVVGCQLLESSGSRLQDQALLASIKKAEPLPPLPASYFQWTFNAPIRFVPPLRLMLPGLAGKAVPPH